MSNPEDNLAVADFFAKIDAMRKAGDKTPGPTIMGELFDYVEQVRDGAEFDEMYFENQLWLLYIAGMAGGIDRTLHTFTRVTPRPKRPGTDKR
jgi:hypothetical protein